MIIDSHTHLTVTPDTKFSISLAKNLEFLTDEMKESGIDQSIIITCFKNGDGMRPTTDDLFGLAPDRSHFKVMASLDIINFTAEELRKLEKYMEKRLVVGVKLYTGYQHFYPNDERCLPVYKLCIKYDLPVVFHSGDTIAGLVENPKVKYSHPLNIDDVAADLPALKIIIAHMGNPWLVDCAEVLYKNPNVYADISGIVIGDDLDTPYGEMLRDRIHDMINYVGRDHKLLYGTDWPLCPMKVYLKFAESLNLEKEAREDLFYKNAEKVFRL